MAEQGTASQAVFKARELHGRKPIRLPYSSIDESNVAEALGKALSVHHANAADIEYLWNYCRGVQPVIERIKEVRPEICNVVVENRASEIKDFYTGYVFGEPITYTSRREEASEAVEMLNDWMFSEAKQAEDMDIGESMVVCGIAHRMVLPDKAEDLIDEDSPFEIWTLPSDSTFVAYSADYSRRPLFGCTYSLNEDEQTVYDVYTPKKHFRVIGCEVVMSSPNPLQRIPIIEYPANSLRMGAFEVVISLLDAINTVESNRVDGVEQFVQYLIKFVNCDMDAEKFEEMRRLGAIMLTSTNEYRADVDIMTAELSQTETQTLVDNLYDAVLTICGIPNRNGKGSSTSDTGQAVIMRDGWQNAESRAKAIELSFKRSEQEFLKCVLKICRETRQFGLRFSDIDMKFTRRNYEAIQSKSQVLCQMLAQPKIAPIDAYTTCGLFSDPESACTRGLEWSSQQMASMAAQMMGQPAEEGEEEPEEGEEA